MWFDTINNLGPGIWGYRTWQVLYYYCMTYPISNPTPAEQAAVVAHFGSLRYLLPCDSCKVHYTEDFAVHGGEELRAAAAAGRAALMQWQLDLHNRVSTMLSKPTLTFDTLEAFLGANVSAQACKCTPALTRSWLPGDAYTWSVLGLSALGLGLLVALIVLGVRGRRGARLL